MVFSLFGAVCRPSSRSPAQSREYAQFLDADGENRRAAGISTSSAPGRGSTARRCPLSRLGLCEGISTIREKSRICWSGRMRGTEARSKKLCDWPATLSRAILAWQTASRLRLGVGQRFGMVEQRTANQLAMPLLRAAALLFRRRLSARPGIVSISRVQTPVTGLTQGLLQFVRGKPPTPGVVAPLCVYFGRRSGRSRTLRGEVRCRAKSSAVAARNKSPAQAGNRAGLNPTTELPLGGFYGNSASGTSTRTRPKLYLRAVVSPTTLR
jgi:hypothetical protein